MCHNSGLGLSGLIKPGGKIMVLPLNCDDKKDALSLNRKVLVEEDEIKTKKTWLGANPIRANKIFRNKIEKKLFKKLKNVLITDQEFKILDSRLDFKGIDKNNNDIFIEVKNVVITDYNISTAPKNIKFFDKNIEKKKYKKIGVFPDAHSKPGTKLVSPRAYKHLLTLEKISKEKIKELY